MKSRHAILRLWQYLDDATSPPFDWVVEHAADGVPQAAWDAGRDASAMLQVYARTGDIRGLTKASCACARKALRFIPRGDLRPLRAIQTAEAWARGEATLEALGVAQREAGAAAELYNAPVLASTEWKDRADASAASAIHYAASIPARCPEALSGTVDVMCITIVGAYQVGMKRSMAGRVLRESLPRTVRRVLPRAPSLAQLFAEFR